MSDKPRILYSSDGSHKLLCKKCGFHPCRCPKAEDFIPNGHTLKVQRETQGRGGKTVTAILGFPDNPSYLKALTSELKTHCGCGGASKECRIEIQGDHREKIKLFLEKKGFKVKFSGG